MTAGQYVSKLISSAYQVDTVYSSDMVASVYVYDMQRLTAVVISDLNCAFGDIKLIVNSLLITINQAIVHHKSETDV